MGIRCHSSSTGEQTWTEDWFEFKLHIAADIPRCNTPLKTWNKVKPARPTYYDLGWLCLFWFCTGVFKGEIHCVQELGCHWAQSNQLSHRFNKQLPKDIITPQCCFYTNTSDNTSEKQRPTAALATVDLWASVSSAALQHTALLG